MTTHTYIFVLDAALALNTSPDLVFFILDETDHCLDCIVLAFACSSYQFSWLTLPAPPLFVTETSLCYCFIVKLFISMCITRGQKSFLKILQDTIKVHSVSYI